MVKLIGHGLLPQADEGVVFQVGQGQLLAGQGGVGQPSHQDLPEALEVDLFQGGLGVGGGGHHRKVDLPIAHRPHRLGGGVVVHLEPDAGVLGVEGLQLFQQVDVQGRLAGADGHAAVFQAGAGRQLLLRHLDLGHGGCNVLIQVLPFRRQLDAPVGADEQGAVGLLFQAVHGPGHVGLAVAQGVGRPGEVLVLGNIIEDLVVFKVDVHRSPS